MTTIREYLRASTEQMPRWLFEYGPGSRFPTRDFFRSRVVYYPGSGFDGQPVKLFGSSHSAHSFVYVDFGLTRELVEVELANPSTGLAGYRPSGSWPVAGRDLFSGWTDPHFDRDRARDTRILKASDEKCGFLQVLDRLPDLGDEHVPTRLAILFLFVDGITAYDAIFCQVHDRQPPFAVLLQDHGFGGNYDRFGHDGLLHQIVERSGVTPEYLLVASGTDCWGGYERCANVLPDSGGLNGKGRWLWRRGTERELPTSQSPSRPPGSRPLP